MSQGTLYVMEQSPRSFILADLVKHFKLDVKITTEKDRSEERRVGKECRL